jgi:hypothetical protein
MLGAQKPIAKKGSKQIGAVCCEKGRNIIVSYALSAFMNFIHSLFNFLQGDMTAFLTEDTLQKLSANL